MLKKEFGVITANRGMVQQIQKVKLKPLTQ